MDERLSAQRKSACWKQARKMADCQTGRSIEWISKRLCWKAREWCVSASESPQDDPVLLQIGSFGVNNEFRRINILIRWISWKSAHNHVKIQTRQYYVPFPHTKMFPLESPVMVSPFSAKVTHKTNLGFSCFCKSPTHKHGPS